MYTLKIVVRIWNDATGEYIEVGPDSDSIGLIEIRSYTDDQKLAGAVAFTPEQAKFVAEALIKISLPRD